MSRERSYSILCWVSALPLLAMGAGLFIGFFRYHAPGSEGLPFPLGSWGHYFAAFAGCALIAWGISLVGAARRPATGRSVGTATAVGLALAGTYRMLAWVVGDYVLVGDVLRLEAAIMIGLSLAFVWLRPVHPARNEAS